MLHNTLGVGPGSVTECWPFRKNGRFSEVGEKQGGIEEKRKKKEEEEEKSR